MFKGLLVAASVIVAQAASAENFYECQVSYKNKHDYARVLPTANGTLSDVRYGSIELGERNLATVLKIIVLKNGQFEGYVNGQRNFKLSGGVLGGGFESAQHIGSIFCETAEKSDFAFVRKNSNEIIRSEFPLKTPANYGLYCLVGSFDRAELALKAKGLQFVESQVTKAGLAVTVNEQKCKESTGSHVDDYKCHKYGPVTQVTYTLEKCDRPELVDPR